MIRLMVTGSNGQLARSLVERARARAGIEVVAVGRPMLDLANPASIHATILRIRPDIVVSAAAFTQVDAAEQQGSLAYRINVTGAAEVAHAADSIGAPIIHISSDYVFAGDKRGFYEEIDAPEPLSVYGATKLEGEKAVMGANARNVIIRTAWAYSPYGQNFLKTMLNLAARQRTIPVVADRWGCPTSMLDLADGILHMAERLGSTSYGLYHLAGDGVTNWAGFAREIMTVSKRDGGPSALIQDIEAAAYPTPATRPANSSLSSGFFERRFGWRMPPWQHSVAAVTRRLVHDMSLSNS